MDTLSHGLWGAGLFGQSKEKKTWAWAFWLGMAPDLLSFGPYFLTRLGTIIERWRTTGFGPPPPHAIPSYVYGAYNVTHSLVVWAVLMAAISGARRRPFWPLAAWALHILCDIPMHSVHFFPTPYLWPLNTPFVDGIPWGRSIWYLPVDFGALAALYLILYFRRRSR